MYLSLRRALSATAVVAVLTLTLAASPAQAGTFSRSDSSPVVRFEVKELLKGLWSSVSHLFATDTARIDPNGGGVYVIH